MEHTFKELSTETAAVPAGGELWGAIVAQRHPAGGAGSYPTGMKITWKDEEGQANANRIVLCCNSHDELVGACEGLAEELENLEQDECITACQCVGKTPEMICDPLPCNYCKAKQILSASTKPS